jgi:hypothetical protein
MFKKLEDILQRTFRSLVYEYRVKADWGKEQSFIVKMRINRFTKSITILDETVIRTTF